MPKPFHADVPTRDEIIVVRHKDFDASLKRLFQLGGQRKKRAEKIAGILESINLEGIEYLKKVPVTNHGESRIKSCVKYDIGDGYRMVTVHKDRIFWLLFVGNHDECDSWLKRNSGIELFYSREEKTWEPFYKSSSQDGTKVTRPPKPSDGPILDRLPVKLQGELLEGVPPLTVVRISQLTGTIAPTEIESICHEVPEPDKSTLLQDVLTLLSADDRDNAVRRMDEHYGRAVVPDGLPDAEILTIKDGDTVRRLVIGSVEYENWLQGFSHEGPHLEWLLFMHPEQQRIAEEDFEGAAQLSGVSGSGKTCIAVRRALRLAEQDHDARVLLVTLNRSLAGLIKMLVGAAAGDSRIKDQITVTSFFELSQELLSEFEPEREKQYLSVSWKLEEHIDEVFREYYRCWTNSNRAKVLLPIHTSLTAQGINSEHYLREEFDWIRSAVAFDEREKYVDANELPRWGRRYPIQENWRRQILEGLGAWEEKMEAVGAIDYLGLTTALSRHIDKLEPRYENVIVDEAQDFGTQELKIIRKLARAGTNDLFLCGDIAQHILPKHRMLSQAGIHLANRTRRITKNYRNTRQILEAAYHVLYQNLHEEMLDRAEKDLEILDPNYANRSSNDPLVLKADNLAEEIKYARSVVSDHLDLYPHAKCCIAIAGYSLCEIERYARENGLTALDGSHDPLSNPLVLSDLEQTKGYEFDLVVIVNCQKGVLPPHDAPKEEVYRDGCRLYVAMTRAKNDLYISYHGEPSEWLMSASDKLTFESWGEVTELRNDFEVAVPSHITEIEDEGTSSELSLDGFQFCYTKLAVGLSHEAQHKLMQLVDGRGAREAGRGRVKWRTVSDAMQDLETDPRARRLFGPSTSAELREAFGPLASRS